MSCTAAFELVPGQGNEHSSSMVKDIIKLAHSELSQSLMDHERPREKTVQLRGCKGTIYPRVRAIKTIAYVDVT